jgi:hypothetical protein
MKELTEGILARVKEIEDVKKVSDHLVLFETGGNYSISFIYPNDKDRIKALKPIFDEITSVFGDRIDYVRAKKPKIKTHHQTPRFNAFENKLRSPPKELYVTYEIWFKPEYETCST